MISSKQKEKLDEVLKNNAKWPLIIEGAEAGDFEDAYVMSGSVEERMLYTKDVWLKFLKGKKYLVLDGIDALDLAEQLKFENLLKNRGLGGAYLPDTVQIVVPVLSVKKLNPKLKEWCLSVKL
ncbi:MAG: hypothetical protein IJS26_01125 [Alphaproteobacteria bacterium]|nr:hypothetical protein [Alphaproteobacteria bacterium]